MVDENPKTLTEEQTYYSFQGWRSKEGDDFQRSFQKNNQCECMGEGKDKLC